METTNNGDMNMNVLQRKHDVRDMKMDDNGNGFAYLNGNVDTNHRDDRKPAEIEGVLPASMFSQVFTCCLAGITFGFVLEKGRGEFGSTKTRFDVFFTGMSSKVVCHL